MAGEPQAHFPDGRDRTRTRVHCRRLTKSAPASRRRFARDARTPSARTARIGVTLVKLAVEKELDWLFREQPSEDYGIDAQVEIVEDEVAVEDEIVTGKLLGFQIKGGASWFKGPDPTAGGFARTRRTFDAGLTIRCLWPRSW
jgi:Domain of unknown function (DUF4365)